MSKLKQKTPKLQEPKEFELYGNPNDRMHPFNYREFLKVKGQLPEPIQGRSDEDMYNRTLDFQAKKARKK